MSKKAPNRYLTLVAAIAIQLCLGVAYIWSVFQTGVAESLFAGNNAQAGLAYSILLAVLTVGSVTGGIMTTKMPIRNVVMIGGFILSAGFFLASFTSPEFPQLLWLTYGVMGGIGMGFAYSTTIACAQKWFPEKKGMVTGLIVAALGAGGLVFTPLVETIISAFGGQGQGEMMAFRIIAGVFFVVCTVGSLFLYNPPEPPANPNAANEPKPGTFAILKKVEFYMITGTMMLACMSGLMMIGFAKPIATGRGMAEIATLGVLSISVSNALGRFFWGLISDKLGRINTLLTLMIGTTGMALLVNFARGYWIFVLIGCIGFFYGGLLSNYPTLTAEVFGAKAAATNYGMVLLGFGVAAIVSSYIAGAFLDLAAGDMDKMFPAFLIAAICSLVAFVVMLALKFRLRKKAKAQNA